MASNHGVPIGRPYIESPMYFMLSSKGSRIIPGLLSLAFASLNSVALGQGPRTFQSAVPAPEDAQIIEALHKKFGDRPTPQNWQAAVAEYSSKAAELKSPSMRSKFLLSCAKASAEHKDYDASARYLMQAYGVQPTNDQGLLAAAMLIDQYQSQSEFTPAIDFVDGVLKQKMTPDQSALFVCKKSILQASSKDPAGAEKTLLTVPAELRSDVFTSSYEHIATIAGINGDHNLYYEMMTRIRDQFPEFGNTARFLVNYSDACLTTRHTDAAAAALKTLVGVAKDDPRIADYQLMLGNMLSDQGDKRGAAEAYAKVLSSPAPPGKAAEAFRGVQAAARTNLDHIEQATPGIKLASSAPEQSRVNFLAIGVFVVASAAAIIVAITLRSKRDRS